MKTRNFVHIAMMTQFSGKGGVMHDRRAPRGGAKNEQVEYLKEYEEEKEDSTAPSKSGTLA